jgi:PAS domain S-box-containing protein
MTNFRAKFVICCILALVIAFSVSRHLTLKKQQKKESSTYEKVLIVLEETNTAMMQVEAHGNRIYAPNSIACSMFGYSFEELDGLEVAKLIPIWYQPEHDAKMKAAMNLAEIGHIPYPGVTMDCTAVRKDGREINVFVRVYIGKSGVVAIANLASQMRFTRMPKPSEQPSKDAP